jgi:hypothetical protein
MRPTKPKQSFDPSADTGAQTGDEEAEEPARKRTKTKTERMLALLERLSCASIDMPT